MSAANATLTTARLTLEPLAESHAALLFGDLSDAELFRFVPQNPPASAEKLAERYKRLMSRSSPDGTEWWLNWALRLGADGAYVGIVEGIVEESGQATLGCTIFTAHQRKGYGAEASTILREHMLDAFGASSVVAFVDTRNVAFAKLVEKIGFKREGLLPDADHFKGARSDEYRYRYKRAAAKSASKPASKAKAKAR